ncbi:MAG TPA: hypothetical protein VNA26_01505 [Chitinophagaceae bacterium]|nr:hypothetical protein [Chitinophagaceae bacterium]
MKKIFGIAVVIAFLTFSVPGYAQDTTEKKGVVEKTGQGIKKGAKKGWKGTKKGAKAVGNETAETATKAKAKVTDKKSEDWVGPGGQTIYVDDGSKYYWINEKGARVFVSKEKLKAKQK